VAHGLYEGMTVNTKFGKGEIRKISENRATVYIFDRGTLVQIGIAPQWIWTDDNEPYVEPQEPLYSPLSVNTLEKDQLYRHQALHSLRFGLVPHQVLPELTYGFAELEEWVLDCLPPDSDGPPKIAEVFGQYGTGKSHTMAVVRYIAKREGYVTARVEVDGRGVTLADPERLLSCIWSSLEADGLTSATPLLDLYLRAIENGHEAPSIAPHGIDRIADNYCTIDLLKRRGILDLFEFEYDAIVSSHNEITASELQRQIFKQHQITVNDEISVKRMIGMSVVDRPYDFVESLFGHAIICNLAGYKGLVVTIDEFEVEHLGNNWKRVEALIATLTKYLTGETSHPQAPCALFFATVDQPEHQGDKVVDQLIDTCDGEYYSLTEMDWDAMKDIGRRIHKLYKETYGISEPFSVDSTQGIYNLISTHSGRVRSFIKHYLAHLDDKFGPPS
jgi:hypothetical protein